MTFDLYRLIMWTDLKGHGGRPFSLDIAVAYLIKFISPKR